MAASAPTPSSQSRVGSRKKFAIGQRGQAYSAATKLASVRSAVPASTRRGPPRQSSISSTGNSR